MFVGQKRIHPMLEKEAKNIVMKMGVVPRKVVRQRM
jgi:sorbitol-specific phosphotransferase system component IIC